jgi:threonine dehydrogenase-like Zn-dependent dehydrogenase
MRAVCWHGKGDVRVDTVPDPKIEHPRDVIIKITACAICGSDLHLLDGYQPTMEKGDVLGHENMGEVIELGSAVTNLRVGDRVVVPFTISCGQCWFCQKGLYSCWRPDQSQCRNGEKGKWVIRPPDCSASAICWGDSGAVRHNISACRLPTWVPSRSQIT